MSPLRSPGPWRRGCFIPSPRPGPAAGRRVTLYSLSHSSEHPPFLSKSSLYAPGVGGKGGEAARFPPVLNSHSCAAPGTGPSHPGAGALAQPRPSPGVQRRSSEPRWGLLSTEVCRSRRMLLLGGLYCAQPRVRTSKFWTREDGSE